MKTTTTRKPKPARKNKRATATELQITDSGWINNPDGTRTFYQNLGLGQFPVTHGVVEVEVTIRADENED